jgi:hypothetical protein
MLFPSTSQSDRRFTLWLTALLFAIPIAGLLLSTLRW